MSVIALVHVPHLEIKNTPPAEILTCSAWTVLGLQSSGGASLDGLKMDGAMGAADKENGGAGNGDGLPSCRPEGTQLTRRFTTRKFVMMRVVIFMHV